VGTRNNRVGQRPSDVAFLNGERKESLIERLRTARTNPPALTLNNGVSMPMLGLGVFQSPPEQTPAAVEAAIADGYRLIDTAASYDNEREVGTAIRDSGIDRGEIFVTTKLWISDYGFVEALVGFEGCLRRLGLDYVDLFLLHQPVPTDFDGTVAAYTAMEKLLSDGRARAIGVANFSERHLENLIERTAVVPAVNQVELHPFFTQQRLRAFHKRHGVTTEAWSPLGGIHRYRPADPDAVLNALEHPTVTAIADTYGKTPAQVVLRWHVEHGVVAIPKSVKPHRIAENIDAFDFELTADELAAIDRLDTGVRAGPDPEAINITTYPKTVEND
jgi:diketogulonate reductase-like aldo/keto reductase